jgi:hypothetical protein
MCVCVYSTLIHTITPHPELQKHWNNGVKVSPGQMCHETPSVILILLLLQAAPSWAAVHSILQPRAPPHGFWRLLVALVTLQSQTTLIICMHLQHPVCTCNIPSIPLAHRISYISLSECMHACMYNLYVTASQAYYGTCNTDHPRHKSKFYSRILMYALTKMHAVSNNSLTDCFIAQKTL